MQEQDRVPLLGKLVTAGFGAGRLEVMATFALTALLEDEAVAERFTTWLADQGDVPLPQRMCYKPEAPVGTGRIDVAGFDGSTMGVAVEAKFAAELTSQQLMYYSRALPKALVVVLVPEPRRSEAEKALSMVARTSPNRSLVVTWDQTCDALAGASTSDVEQFRALCQAACGLDVAPLQQHDLGAGRRERLGDLHRVADQVSTRLHQSLGLGRLLPSQPERDGFSWHRYVDPKRDAAWWFAVGVRSFETGPQTPFWLRWHRDTGNGAAAAIAEALAGVPHSRDDGRVWVPLVPELHLAGRHLVDGLAEQAHSAHRHASAIDAPRATPSS